MVALDRRSLWVMSILVALTLIIIGIGDRTLPQVKEFSWQDQSITSADTAFILKFNRRVDRQSIERGLKIEPPLPGKVSWAGQRMAYTLTSPAAYGQTYRLNLDGGRETVGKELGKELVPFRSQFQTPDGVLAYISSEGKNWGQLLLYNFRTQTATAITPPQLVVTDFKVDREGQKVLFSAIDRRAANNQQPPTSIQKIYSLDRDLRSSLTNSQPIAAELIVDSQDYQNLKFDLSRDGSKLLVQRANRRDLSDLALWYFSLVNRQDPPVKIKHIGDFLITPDGSAVAAAAGEGVSISPLVDPRQSAPTEANNDLDFLPKFGTLLSFSEDGTTAAVVKFNNNYTKSLYVVNDLGKQDEVLKINGSILAAKFAPNKNFIYCLATELKTTNNLAQEHPYLAAIDLQKKKVLPLLRLPAQQGIQIDLAPDGLAIAIDQAEKATNLTQLLTGQDRGVLWLLPIPPNPEDLNDSIAPVRLPFSGWHPLWLP
jgi:hypothetical protein